MIDVEFMFVCEAWNCRYSCMGRVRVSSCRFGMFVSCVHPVSVLNAAFCITCGFLEEDEDEEEEEISLLRHMIHIRYYNIKIHTYKYTCITYAYLYIGTYIHRHT